MLSQEHVRIVKKIPFFQGLGLGQAQKVLELGQVVSFSKGHTLFRVGENSSQLFKWLEMARRFRWKTFPPLFIAIGNFRI